MIDVYLKYEDGMFDEFMNFDDFVKAERYFYSLSRKRSRVPACVVASVEGVVRMQYFITDVHAGTRWRISQNLIDGSPAQRKYIPAAQELVGRRIKVDGSVRLPVTRVTAETSQWLRNEASSRLMTVSSLVRSVLEQHVAKQRGEAETFE